MALQSQWDGSTILQVHARHVLLPWCTFTSMNNGIVALSTATKTLKIHKGRDSPIFVFLARTLFRALRYTQSVRQEMPRRQHHTCMCFEAYLLIICFG